MGILALNAFYFAIFRFYKNLSLGSIQDIGINTKFYPKHYKTAPKFMRRWWDLKHKIPKFILFRLWMALVFLCTGPIISIIFLCCNQNAKIIIMAMFIPCAPLLLDVVVFLITIHIFEKW